MRRREFIARIGSAEVGFPFLARAEDDGQIHRRGIPNWKNS
jgi:hypothetical protein